MKAWLTTRLDRLAPSSRAFVALGSLNYASMGLALALSIVLTRRLGVDRYGQLAMLLMVMQVFLLATANWTHLGFVRFASQAHHATGQLAPVFWSRVAIAAPVGVGCLAALLWYRDWAAAYLGVPTWTVGILALHCAVVFLMQALGASSKHGSSSLGYGATLVLEKAAVLALAIVVPMTMVNVPAILILHVTGAGLVVLVSLAIVGPTTFLPLQCRPVGRQLFAFSLPLLFSSWAGFFGGNWFDFLVVRHYRPLSDIGLYSLGWQLAAVAQQITIVFSTLLLPRISIMVARGDHEGIARFLQQILPGWLLATSVLFGGVLLVAPWAVPFVFKAEFAAAVPVLALLMMASSALALYNGLVPLVSASGQTWLLSGVTFLSAVTNIVLDLVLVPRFGIQGSATATVVAYSVSAVLVLVLVQKRFGHVRRLPWYLTPVPAIYAIMVLIPGPMSYVAGGLCVAVGAWKLLRMHVAGRTAAMEGAA